MQARSSHTRAWRMAAGTLIACVVALGAPAAQVVDFPDFTSTTGLTLNGATTATGGVLRLVPELIGQAGSAFWSVPLTTQASFETSFRFQISGAQPTSLRSDGLAFLIHGDPRGDTALGIGGGALGYSYEQGPGVEIRPSLLVEFDIYQNGWDPDDHHVALMVDGEKTNHVTSASVPGLLDDGEVQNVSIVYDAEAKLLSVSTSEGADPLALLFTELVDLPALAGDSAWFGFTAATGGGYADHDLLDWQLTQDTGCSTLDVVGDGLPCTELGFVLSGAPPHAPAFLIVGLDAGTTALGVGSLGRLTLDLAWPWIPIPLGLTDEVGGADLNVPLPPWPLPLIGFYGQAVTIDAKQASSGSAFCTSNLVEFTVGGF
jgi:hypothetical protein